MSTQPSDEEPKLIIDEDWKTQVLREKEELKKKQTSAEPTAENTTPSADELADSQQVDTPEPPPASFEFLISGMATQAVAAMGQLPDDKGKSFPKNLDYARHYIDLLGVIETKTAGNLTDHEQRFLQDTLYQLRMLFVSVKDS